MLKAGVPDDEIKDFFQKYDTDGDMTMDKKELDRLKQSFEKLGRTSSTEARQGLFAFYLPTMFTFFLNVFIPFKAKSFRIMSNRNVTCVFSETEIKFFLFLKVQIKTCRNDLQFSGIFFVF